MPDALQRTGRRAAGSRPLLLSQGEYQIMHGSWRVNAIIIGVLLSAIVAGVAVAQSFTHVVNLARGQTAYITCDGANRLRIDRQGDLIALLTCGRAEQQPQPTATPTVPAPQPTATATPLPVPPSEMIDMYWHPPMTHGDRPTHEHGDPPPSWVLDYLGVSEVGAAMLFQHAGNTPGENVAYWKHVAFKGYAGSFNGVEWYGVFHLDFQPAGRTSRFHSYQLWVRNVFGVVSHFNGWLDFGTGNNTGPQVVETCGQDSGIRPIMLVTLPGCPVRFENWYARAGGSGAWAPDIGFNINPNYYAGGDPADPSTWTPTGGIRNVDRRIEWAWYANRSSIRGAFWATQWGDIVSGPSDPVCGTQRTYGDKSYTVLCLEQYIAPSMPSVQFPGNAVQRTFDSAGVVLPN